LTLYYELYNLSALSFSYFYQVGQSYMQSGHSFFPAVNANPLGSLLTPISQLTEDLTLANLIASKQEIYNYLEIVNANQPMEKILQQPTPAGMALIANYYNKKQDQLGINIYIASTIADLQHFATDFNQQESGKAIVIFQPSEFTYSKEKPLYATHKVVIYFEKRLAQLHVLIDDSTPYSFIREATMNFLNQVLQNSPRTYYTQKVAKLPEDNNPIVLQGDYWSCGTHAFRLARFMAKTPGFLQQLEIASSVTSASNASITLVEYVTPTKFLKLADTKIGRTKCADFFGEKFEAMENHYVRYDKDFSYTVDFTRKYLSLIAGFVVDKSAVELLQDIKTADAKNYFMPGRELNPNLRF
jgi:hypothetical protein